MAKSRIRDRKLASAYGALEIDVRNMRRLLSLAHGLFHELPPEFELQSQEEFAALLWAIDELTIDIEERWDAGFRNAGGDAKA